MKMDRLPLYPLQFEPIYQYRPWGGRRLADLLSARLPGDGPIGEAWLLSDRDDHSSLVAEGPLKGKTIGQILEESPEDFLGNLAGHYDRFPVLLKSLDVRDTLSVQVHPSDGQKELIPAGDTGKTEAWVVLEKGPEARIYAGLKPETTSDVLRRAITNGTVADQLASFAPRLDDAVFIPAGTAHALSDLVVFEIQENSDATFRLYDWDHIDPQTGQRRPLQVDRAMACIDFTQGAICAVTPRIHETKPLPWENLIHCNHFESGESVESSHLTGATKTCRALVCIDGEGELEHADVNYRSIKATCCSCPPLSERVPAGRTAPSRCWKFGRWCRMKESCGPLPKGDSGVDHESAKMTSDSRAPVTDHGAPAGG